MQWSMLGNQADIVIWWKFQEPWILIKYILIVPNYWFATEYALFQVKPTCNWVSATRSSLARFKQLGSLIFYFLARNSRHRILRHTTYPNQIQSLDSLDQKPISTFWIASFYRRLLVMVVFYPWWWCIFSHLRVSCFVLPYPRSCHSRGW